MNKLFILLLFITPFLYSQTKMNFFPLNLGNQYLIRDSSISGPPLTIHPISDSRKIITDTLNFRGKILYNYNYNYYYYNLDEQKLYTLKNDTLVLSIDFSSSATDSVYVNFDGISHICKLSGVFQSYYGDTIRNCYSLDYNEGKSTDKYNIQDVRKYVFCENVGLIYSYRYHFEEWYYPPLYSDIYYSYNFDSTISAIINNVTIKPIAPPVFYLSDSIKDRRIDEFPFYLRSFFGMQYPELITSAYVQVTGIRDSVIISNDRYDFNRAVGLAKIVNPSSYIQPGDSVKIYCQLNYYIFSGDSIRIPATGTLGFKVLPPASSVRNMDIIPGKYDLSGYPNPFNPSAKIRYSLPEEADIRLEIFSPLGNKIKVLESGIKSPGIHEISWNASSVSSGIYCVRLVSKSSASGKFFNKTIKMVYLK